MPTCVSVRLNGKKESPSSKEETLQSLVFRSVPVPKLSCGLIKYTSLWSCPVPAVHQGQQVSQPACVNQTNTTPSGSSTCFNCYLGDSLCVPLCVCLPVQHSSQSSCGHEGWVIKFSHRFSPSQTDSVYWRLNVANVQKTFFFSLFFLQCLGVGLHQYIIYDMYKFTVTNIL